MLSAWSGFKKCILTCMLGIIGMGVGILVFGLLPIGRFYTALSGIFLLGVIEIMANGPLDAILYAAVDPDIQGRVYSPLGAVPRQCPRSACWWLASCRIGSGSGPGT